MEEGNKEKKPRTPQIYRQCWQVLKENIEKGGLIRTKAGLIHAIDEIEEMVRG